MYFYNSPERAFSDYLLKKSHSNFLVSEKCHTFADGRKNDGVINRQVPWQLAPVLFHITSCHLNLVANEYRSYIILRG
jgi:hypothetical protein